ncbi:unnamed protein product [Cylicocyclus nassatus]|uniref:Uncharacterized protein n=1 Tax=Cylicocyclus nassatus TaxID=53992 RepID=A0AA36H445_CYLNA|nr:unnamed protein product [Cylicocyclus nassatus]
MMPVARKLQFLFRGNLIYMWMLISAFYMIIVWFTIRPLLFNSVASAYIGSPMITESHVDFAHYTSLCLTIHNSTLAVTLATLYFIVCFYIRNRSSVSRSRLQIFVQVLFISLSTGLTAILYIALEFLPIPHSVVIAAHVVWQLSHGIHGIIYLCFNLQIRKETYLMLFSLAPVPSAFIIQ